jgi:ABC-type sugar transport system substrate-binding protein
MRLAVIVLAIAALASATSAADAKHRHHTRVVIHPTYVHPATQAWWYGSAAYPAHMVPLAAYPSPGGIGLIWAPFGWGYAQR